MYSCIFHNPQEYDFKVLFYRNAFLVDITNTSEGRVLNLDTIAGAQVWNGIDVTIFNTWHWWTHTGSEQPYVEPLYIIVTLIWFLIFVLELYVEVNGFSILFLNNYFWNIMQMGFYSNRGKDLQGYESLDCIRDSLENMG